jgi:hypothetical protein
LRRAREGRDICEGTRVRTDALDYAVLDTLNRNVARGDLLNEVFEAWEQDEEAAMGTVRRLERLYHETQQKVDNSAARLAAYAVDDPAAAPVEATMRMYAEQLPGLIKQRDDARAAVVTARNNTALRDDLNEWFTAWMAGWQELSNARLRQFLFALKATVRVYRPGDRSPRAVLTIGLPTSALDLPPVPGISITDDGIWQADVDTDAGATLAAATLPLSLGTEQGAPVATADEMMAAIKQELLFEQQQEEDAGFPDYSVLCTTPVQ